MERNNYITKRGYESLVTERDHLTKVERPEVTKVVAWAASLGDRSENADYQYGKKRLREIDRRVRFLNTRINTASIVDPKTLKLERIQLGLCVVVEEEEKENCYQIVGVDEVDLNHGRISWKSPLGKALLGKEPGDEVIFETPKGERELTIIEIQYPEESS